MRNGGGSGRRRRETLLALLATVALLAGCTSEDAAGAGGEPLPDWLLRVYPAPGAESSATQGVQVEWVVDESADQIVRLLLDGTDVTTASETSGGEISYAPEEGVAPVELDPGQHTATAELVEVDESSEEVVDRYQWTFSIL